MRRILLIGIGPGNPDYVTVQAIEALNRADVFFLPDKGAEKATLRELRQEILARFIRTPRYRTVDIAIPARDAGDDYRAGVDAWHARLEAAYEALIAERLAEGECGAFLVWGDPTLYDSTLRLIERIRARGAAFEYEVIPGISAPQALAAQHRVPLNRIGEPVLITTGRRLAEGLCKGSADVVVMLDGDLAFTRIDPAGVEIFWAAYLGTEDEIRITGELSEVRDEIVRTRRAARAKKGWIMDTYLLRRHRAA